MNPLDNNNLILQASILNLTFENKALEQFQEILKPIVTKLWKVSNVEDVLNNWDEIIGDSRLDIYHDSIKSFTYAEQFGKLVFEEVNILINDFLNDLKIYLEDDNLITIDSIYGVIYTIDTYIIEASK